MNRLGSFSPLMAIGQQLLSGLGGKDSFFSQQIINFVGNVLKQQGGEFLKGMMERNANPDLSRPSSGADYQPYQPRLRPNSGLFNWQTGPFNQQPDTVAEAGSPNSRPDANHQYLPRKPFNGTAPGQTSESLSLEDVVQKYLFLLDKAVAHQTNLQDQLGVYRRKLTRLQTSPPQGEKQNGRPRGFFLRAVRLDETDAVKTLKEVDIWLTTVYREVEQVYRNLVAESKGLTGFHK